MTPNAFRVFLPTGRMTETHKGHKKNVGLNIPYTWRLFAGLLNPAQVTTLPSKQ